jgi:endo-1,4-beta-xylanase
MYFSFAAALVALVSLKTATAITQPNKRTEPPTSSPTGPPYLNHLAQDHHKIWFGTAADIPGPEQDDVGYMTVLNDTKIFGQLTPANYMKVKLIS